MSIWQAIVLGFVQGATEYAPVSSSGHLILVPWLFDWQQLGGDAGFAKTFDVALHMGTLLGAVIYFRTDLWRYLRAWFRTIAARAITTSDERIAWALVIGTIPGAVVGALAESVIQERLGAPGLIAVMLAVFGVVLYEVDRRMPSVRGIDSIGVRTGLFLGLAQAMALQPGVSRSGVTMTAARAIGLDRETAARFSFLLSLPIIAGAGLYKGSELVQTGFQGYEAQFFWGFVSSAVSGFLVIWGLLKYLKRHDFKVFMLYRLAVAGLVLGLIATGVREATI
jgi:undecaprenyl-diphosphatase